MFTSYTFLLICMTITQNCFASFDLTILHTNDVHARFMPFNRFGTDCSEDNIKENQCYGGVARRLTKVEDIRSSHDNVLFLDAGDQFLGTIWFTEYRGLAASYFMNKLDYDVMCLGNHEFDLGVEGLVPFLDNVTFSVVSANTDVTREPRLQNKFTNSVLMNVGGEIVGVIGYTTTDTAFISQPGDTVTFRDVEQAVRAEVTDLENRGVNKIIALGHAGYVMDQKVGAIQGVDIVVGGHTDTFLYTGTPPLTHEDVKGPYPTVIEQTGGKKALVVQDYTWGKYLGYLNVTFDDNGDVTSYSGNPILLDNSTSQDDELARELESWQVPLDTLRNEVIGSTKVILNGTCRLNECNLGNLITDAIIDFHATLSHNETKWSPAAIALVNGGAIRASIGKGNVTEGDTLAVMPFGNLVDIVTVTGKNLRDQLELAVQDYNPKSAHGRFLQFSGLKVVYNLHKPVGNRVVSVLARCLECSVPNFSPVEDSKHYSIYVSSFLINGGDGYSFDRSNHIKINSLDSDTLSTYIKRHSPVWPSVEGRISFEADTTVSKATAHSSNGTLYGLLFFIWLIVLAS